MNRTKNNTPAEPNLSERVVEYAFARLELDNAYADAIEWLRQPDRTLRNLRAASAIEPTIYRTEGWADAARLVHDLSLNGLRYKEQWSEPLSDEDVQRAVFLDALRGMLDGFVSDITK